MVHIDWNISCGAGKSYTPTGRIKAKFVIVGHLDQLPPGQYKGYIDRMVYADLSDLERRLDKLSAEAPVDSHKKPKKYKDVPFWCKRR